MEDEIAYTPGCRHCHSGRTIRHGYTRKGKQRYRCQRCGRCFVENPASAAYDPARKEEILRAYNERASLRGLTRVFGVSRNTVRLAGSKKVREFATPGANPRSLGPR